jgi:uncharacterized membrane protein
VLIVTTVMVMTVASGEWHVAVDATAADLGLLQYVPVSTLL